MINERAAMFSLHDVVFVRFGYVRSLVVNGWVVGLLLACVCGFMCLFRMVRVKVDSLTSR